MIRDDKLIFDFLRNSGDMIYFKMIYGDLLDLTTADGIDIFFFKIEEFAEESVLFFDVDEFLSVNSHMVDYYVNDSKNSVSGLSSVSYGDYVFSSLNNLRTPSFDNLFAYLRVSSEISAVIRTKVKEDVTISHLLHSSKYLNLLSSNPFVTFQEADTEVIDGTTNSLLITNYDQIFNENYLAFWSGLTEPFVCSNYEDLNIIWTKIFGSEDFPSSLNPVPQLWGYMVFFKLPSYYKNYLSIFSDNFVSLDQYINYLSIRNKQIS